MGISVAICGICELNIFSQVARMYTGPDFWSAMGRKYKTGTVWIKGKRLILSRSKYKFDMSFKIQVKT